MQVLYPWLVVQWRDEEVLKDGSETGSMIANPFEKFVRKRFLYYSKSLELISINHVPQARLGEGDYDAVRAQMRKDSAEYYGKLGSEA